MTAISVGILTMIFNFAFELGVALYQKSLFIRPVRKSNR
jgi:hypothetical protein